MDIPIQLTGPNCGGAVNAFLAGEREPIDEILEFGAVTSREGLATLAAVAPSHGLTADELGRAVVLSLRIVRAREMGWRGADSPVTP